MKLTAQFRKGQAVRWYAVAFKTDSERAGWIVEGLHEANQLLPSYKVRNVVTGERGSAMQDELVAIEAGLSLQTESKA